MLLYVSIGVHSPISATPTNKQREHTMTTLTHTQSEVSASTAMYNLVMVTGAMPLCEWSTDWASEVSCIQADLEMAAYCESLNISVPTCPHHFESMQEDAKEAYTGVKASGDTMVIETCNYRGEGTGEITVALTIKGKLPIYISKAQSFIQANS